MSEAATRTYEEEGRPHTPSFTTNSQTIGQEAQKDRRHRQPNLRPQSHYEHSLRQLGVDHTRGLSTHAMRGMLSAHITLLECPAGEQLSFMQLDDSMGEKQRAYAYGHNIGMRALNIPHDFATGVE